MVSVSSRFTLPPLIHVSKIPPNKISLRKINDVNIYINCAYAAVVLYVMFPFTLARYYSNKKVVALKIKTIF